MLNNCDIRDTIVRCKLFGRIGSVHSNHQHTEGAEDLGQTFKNPGSGGRGHSGVGAFSPHHSVG